MHINPDLWLSEVLGRDAYRVDFPRQSMADASAIAVAAVSNHASGRADALYTCRLDTDRVADVGQLCRIGFAVVDVTMTLRFRGQGASGEMPAPGVEIRSHLPSDGDDVLDVAGSSYKYSRFHQDPHMATDDANRVKREWCRSYLVGQRGDRMWLARAGDRTIGFLAALKSPHDVGYTAVIDLVAVDPAYQGQGIGQALVAAFVAHYRQDATALEVGTQAANVPSLRLYERLGFSVVRTQYVAHMHVLNGQVVL